jgi:periplasmic mercuric ion binding protein
MKKMKWLLMLITCFTVIAKAQVVRKGASETATIKIPTVQCDECKKRIESYVSREQGVQKIVVDYKKKIATVTYLWDRTSVENVKAAIANAGYDADDVTADPDAYKRLPTCCKKPEDGGGHDSKKN